MACLGTATPGRSIMQGPIWRATELEVSGERISVLVSHSCRSGEIRGSRRGQMALCLHRGHLAESKSHRQISVRVGMSSSSPVEVSEAEKEGWAKRKSEAVEEEEEGKEGGNFGDWTWTLNWDAVTEKILIGSCPRSPSDIDRMVDEGGVSAIVNLQSDLCFDALQIPFEENRARAIERGVVLQRVPIRDFDHGDQVMMLPEAVRVLNRLLHEGHRVYVHCTAGINRASLAVVGYLTFVRGLSKEEALKMVKGARPVAYPYMDCLSEAKRRLLEGRQEELTALATEIYTDRLSGARRGNATSDWSGAQAIAISRTFQRYLEVDTGLFLFQKDLIMAANRVDTEAKSEKEVALQAEVEELKEEAEQQMKEEEEVVKAIKKWEESKAHAFDEAKRFEEKVTRQAEVLQAQGKVMKQLEMELSALATQNEELKIKGYPERESEAGTLGEEDENENSGDEIESGYDLECDVITRTCAGGHHDA